MSEADSTLEIFSSGRECPFVHLFWAQGWNHAPDFALKNRRMWEDSGALVHLWDIKLASSRFPFFAEHQSKMSHHAMRADVALALAAYEFGGFVIGTDMTPVEPSSMFKFARSVPGFVVRRLEGGVHNGGSYFLPRHPYLQRVIERLSETKTQRCFGDPHVAAVTGPHLWSKVLRERCWLVAKVMTERAFTHGRLRGTTVALNPNAWLNPGFRASWKYRST